MAESACQNDNAPLLGATTTSITEVEGSEVGVTESGVDLSDYLNIKELWEETGVSTKTISIGCAMGDTGVSTKTVWIACNAS